MLTMLMNPKFHRRTKDSEGDSHIIHGHFGDEIISFLHLFQFLLMDLFTKAMSHDFHNFLVLKLMLIRFDLRE